jgi:hypothetical protein
VHTAQRRGPLGWIGNMTEHPKQTKDEVDLPMAGELIIEIICCWSNEGNGFPSYCGGPFAYQCQGYGANFKADCSCYMFTQCE